MKTQLKQAFKSSWALILAVVIGLSALTVTAATLNPAQSGRSSSVEDSGRKKDVEKSGDVPKFTANQTLYLNINVGVVGNDGDNWGIDATIVAHFYYYDTQDSYNSSENIPVNHISGNYYSVTVPNDNYLGYVKFYRKNPSNLSDTYNSSDFMANDGTNNCVKLTGWNNSSVWETYDPSGGGSGDCPFEIRYATSSQTGTHPADLSGYGTLLVDKDSFTEVSDGTYTASVTLAENTNCYIYVLKTDTSTDYYKRGERYLMCRGDAINDEISNCNFEGDNPDYKQYKQFNISGGTYEFTLSGYNVTQNNVGSIECYRGHIALDITRTRNPLADGATLELDPSTIEKSIATNINLTATLINPIALDTDAGQTFTYKFYKPDGTTQIGSDITTTATSASVTCTGYTNATAGDYNFVVKVTTNATNENGDYDTLEKTAPLTVVKKLYYQTPVSDNATEVTEGTALTAMAGKVGSASSNKYSFALYNTTTPTADITKNCNYTIDTGKCEYCTMQKRVLPDDTVVYTIVSTSRHIKGPFTVVVDDSNESDIKIYAKAVAIEKTSETSETVRYYFGYRVKTGSTTATDYTSLKQPSSGADGGLYVRYWTNSTADVKKSVPVTNPANHKGSDGSGTTNTNTIYVYRRAFYQSGADDDEDNVLSEFKVFYVDLPIKATSFDFVDTSGNRISLRSFVKDWKDNSFASLSLNPNRIYLFYKDKDSKKYCKAVTLDQMFWNKTTMSGKSTKNNQVATKLFNSNFVNYDTQYSGASLKSDCNFNNNIADKFAANYSDYKHPMYMGYLDQNTSNYPSGKTVADKFKIWDSLAMRNESQSDDRYYYATVWDLVDDTLATTDSSASGYDANRVNQWGYGYLMDYYGNAPLPYFDYKMLSTSSGLKTDLDEKKKFPMNKSKFEGIDTYSYDSTNDYNRYIDGSNEALSIDQSTSGYEPDPIGAGYLGFFPYLKKTNNNNSNYYGYGAEFDIDFYMTSTGYLLTDKNEKRDITFNFSGDDDVWIFIDGKLVLDLGGAHKISAGTINFTDMKVYYKTAAKDTDLIESIHEDWTVKDDSIKTINMGTILPDFDTYDTSVKHTFQMFYMERGSNEANCMISFNLPQNSGIKVSNKVDVDDVNPGLQKLTLGAANKDSFVFNIQNKAKDGENYSDTIFDAANPKNPVKSANYVVRRIYDPDDHTEQYVLVNKSNSDGASTTKYITDSSKFNASNYNPVPEVNYIIDDTYAEALLIDASHNDGQSHSSADVDEWAVELGNLPEAQAALYNFDISGRTSAAGDFEMFIQQSAKFTDKLPANSYAKVSLSENLKTLDDPGVLSGADEHHPYAPTGSNAVTTTTSTRKVTDYYSTTGSWTNNITKDKIATPLTSFSGEEGSKTMTMSDIYMDKGTTDNADVVVDYVSKPLLESIKISKTLYEKDGTTAITGAARADHTFFFNLEFSKILGYDVTGSVDVTSFTYKVKNADTNADVETRTGLPIYFTADQYAVIENVPVGSTYTLTEVERNGYEFVSASVDGSSQDTNGLTGTIIKGASHAQSVVVFTNKKSATAKLTVKNIIDVSKVNPGLRDAAKWAANTDCFDYGLENKLLTTTEDRVGVYDETDPTYPLGTNSSTSVQRIIGSVADPLPGNTMDLTKREISNYSTKRLLSNTIWLAIENQESSSASAAEPTLNNSTYVKFPNINYKVNDIYANSAVIGRTGNGTKWKGNESKGDFIMLHGQTVTFTDKILGNTKVKITQKREIWGVENTNESTAWEPETTTTQNQDHWYTTNITIYDEAKGVYVYYDGGTEHTTTAAADTAGNRFIKGLSVENPDTDTLYSSDGNGNAIAEFDFKNRKKATANSNMTVTFINSPIIKPIRIQKDVVADSSNTDEFYFDVKFYGVFGANTVREGLFKGTANQNYQTVDNNGYYLYEQLKNLTYNVYKKSDNTLVALNRTYGTDSNGDDKPDGIRIQGDEYAVIYGVPEDTVYSICEDEALMKPYVFKEASLNRIVSKLSGNKVNEVYDTVELLENYESADIKNEPYKWRKYSSDSIKSMTAEQRAAAYNRKKVIAYSDDPSVYPASPTDSDLTVNAENVVFVNRIPTNITFQYYDRDVVTGQYEHLASTPTSAMIAVSDEEKEYAVIPDGQENAGKLDYAKLIKKVINDNKFGPYNLLAEYKVYTSQADAVAGVKNMVYDAATIKEGAETKYSSMYSDEQLAKHFDRFGRVQGQTYNGQPCKVSDGEKWVTYKAYDKESNETDEDKKLKEVEETGATGIIGTDNHKIKNITIWLPQNLRKYTLTVKYATGASQLETGTGTRKVATNGTPITKKDYYFTRLGKKYESTNTDYNDYVNGVSPFLNEFFMTDAYGSDFPTDSIPDVIKIDGQDHEFLGWSLDPEGKAIVSTAKNYEYRITNDCTIYAVYDTPENVTAFAATKGCTTTYAEPDYYTDADGNAQIRINTTMNPYNTLTADGNSDGKIKKAASFYVYGLDDAIEKAKEKVGSTTTLYASIKAAIDKMIQDCASDETDFKHNVSGLYGTYSIKVNGINYDDNNSKVEGFKYTASHTNSENTSKQLPLTNKDRATFANYFPASGMYNMDFFVFTAMKYDGTWKVSDNAVWYNFGNHIMKNTGTKEKYEGEETTNVIDVPDEFTVAYIKYFFSDDTTKKIYEYDPNGTFRLGWKDMT